MGTIMYIWEVLCQAWSIALIMGMVAIPILWIWLEENNEYESLDDYYITSAEEQLERIKKEIEELKND